MPIFIPAILLALIKIGFIEIRLAYRIIILRAYMSAEAHQSRSFLDFVGKRY